MFRFSTIVFVVILCLPIYSFTQNFELWGVTQYGGDYSAGTIFKLDSNGRNHKVVHDFYQIDAEYPIYSHLCEAKNGELYGMTRGGGKNRHGVIFKYDTIADTFIKVHDFNSSTSGYGPYGSLLLASDDWLYGMTASGGKDGGGTFFKLNPNNDTVVVLRQFHWNDTAQGCRPMGSLMQANNGKLYGLNYDGGKYGNGVIFEYDISNDSFCVKHDFQPIITSGPVGELIQAKNNKLYGVTRSGGINYAFAGTIFEYDLTADSFQVVHSFNDTAGAYPEGGLVEANNGKLYGVTPLGGTDWEGVLFEFDISTKTYRLIVDFDKSINGKNPDSRLLKASNGILYGLCQDGGKNRSGILFQYEPKIDSFKVNVHFGNCSSWNNCIRDPRGSLIESSNGKLYGVNFTYEISTNKITQLFQFGGNSKNGVYPKSSLMKYGNKVFGIANSSGVGYYNGVLYSYDIDSDKFEANVHLFLKSWTSSNPDIMLTSDGKIYGVGVDTLFASREIIFSYQPDSNKFTEEYKAGWYGNIGLNGSLIESGGKKLYGTCAYESVNYAGFIYEFDPGLDTLIVKYTFKKSTGSNPTNGLVNYPKSGTYFGMTSRGGKNDNGVLFEANPHFGYYAVRKHFSRSSTGYNPLGKLFLASNGIFYGMMSEGGKHNFGTLFQFDPVKRKLKVLHDFQWFSDGATPKGSLVQGSNNKLYGMTSRGGLHGGGIVFEYDYNKDTLIVIHNFDMTTGSSPVNDLLVIDKCVYSYDTITTTACDLYISPAGKNLTKSGYYCDTLKNVKGCDSFIIIDLTITKSSFNQLSPIVCDQYISPSGKLIDSSGTFIDTIQNYFDCDSIITIDLTVNNTINTNLKVNSCDYFVSPNNKIWTRAGIYYDTLLGHKNCDSIIIFDLKILNKSKNKILKAVCNSYTSPSGKVLAHTGTYFDTIQNFHGCDSIIEIDLRVSYSNNNYIKTSACNYYISPTGKKWTISGIYYDTLQNSSNCDSILSFDLTINKSNFGIINPTTCDTFISSSGKKYFTPGKYIDTLKNHRGCDSFLVINLKEVSFNTNVISYDTVLQAEEQNASYQWLNCDSGFSVIHGATHSSFIPQHKGIFAVELSKSGCVDTSWCYYGKSVSIQKLLKSNIEVYPNPNKGNVNIKFSESQPSFCISIFNSLGELIDQKSFENSIKEQIEMPKNKGIYYISVIGSYGQIFHFVSLRE